MSIDFKMIGTIFSVLGTIIFAWRSYIIVKALEENALIADANFKIIKDFMKGKNNTLPYTTDPYLLIKSSEKIKVNLLLIGIFMITNGMILSNIELVYGVMLPMQNKFNQLMLFISNG